MTRRPGLRRWIGLGVLVAVFTVVPSTESGAAIEEIEATGKYYLGDNDTRIDGHRLALMDAKRNALEKAGTYVRSITEVKDFQLTRDDIRSYTAGIVEVTEMSEPKWEMVGQTQRVTVTVKARVDKDEITKKIATLRTDKEATKELKDARVTEQQHEHKIAELNRQLKKAKKGSPAAERARQARSNEFAGVDAATLRVQAAGPRRFRSGRGWQRATM